MNNHQDLRLSWRLVKEKTYMDRLCLIVNIKNCGFRSNWQSENQKVPKLQMENSHPNKLRLIIYSWTSLVAQWLRIHLPMQGTRVWALVWEHPTCRGAAEPVCHNYWAHVPQLLKPMRLEPVLHNKRSHCNDKPAHCNEE